MNSNGPAASAPTCCAPPVSDTRERTFRFDGNEYLLWSYALSVIAGQPARGSAFSEAASGAAAGRASALAPGGGVYVA